MLPSSFSVRVYVVFVYANADPLRTSGVWPRFTTDGRKRVTNFRFSHHGGTTMESDMFL